MRRRCQRMICLAMSVMLLAACAGKEGEAENRDSFTEEELKEGKAKFRLDDNLYVDAKITTSDKYEGGLNSYYVESCYENDTRQSTEEFFSDTTIFRKPAKENEERIVEAFDGRAVFDPDTKDTHTTGESRDWHYRKQFRVDGEDYELYAQWLTGNQKTERPDCLCAPFMTIAPMEEKNQNIKDGYYDGLKGKLKDPKKIVIEGIDKNLLEEKIRKSIEGITGRKVNEFSEWIPINDETVKLVNEDFEKEGVPLRMQEEEPPFYEVWFYFDVDGLPLLPDPFTYRLKDGEQASKMAAVGSVEDGTLVSPLQWKQKVIVVEKGLEYMELSSIRLPGKIFQKKQKVISPDEVAKEIKKYYEKVLLTEPMTVQSMVLAYEGYFGKDPSDMIVPIFQPVWKVELWSDSMGRETLFYDAFTGGQLS